MIRESEQEVKEALEEVLALQGIHLEEKESEDYSEILSKTQDKLDELNEKAELLLKKTGMSRDEMEIYAANPANFTPEEWNALQKVKEACEKYKRDTSRVISQHVGETSSTEPLRKKQERRFDRKKNWIPL